MNIYHVDSFNENYWCEVIDYSSLLDADAPLIEADLYGNPQPLSHNIAMSMDVSLGEITSQFSISEEKGCSKKRGRTDPYGQIGTKACRERMRRGKLNDRFAELSATLEPGRPAKTDKLAILCDATRVLNQLKTEAQEHAEMNKRLLEEIKILKAEKNELREEKLKLKSDKEKMEHQMKTMNGLQTGFTPITPPVYQAEVNKVSMFPSYGFVPMWHYLPPSARDTSQDHNLRPPAA